MAWVALASAAAALSIASFTLIVTAPWLRPLVADLRRELRACERQRRELRLQMQMVVGSLVGLLSEDKRAALLRQLDRALASGGDEPQADALE